MRVGTSNHCMISKIFQGQGCYPSVPCPDLNLFETIKKPAQVFKRPSNYLTNCLVSPWETIFFQFSEREHNWKILGRFLLFSLTNMPHAGHGKSGPLMTIFLNIGSSLTFCNSQGELRESFLQL